MDSIGRKLQGAGNATRSSKASEMQCGALGGHSCLVVPEQARCRISITSFVGWLAKLQCKVRGVKE